MQLHPVDWVFIVGYCVVAFGIGVYFSKRAGRDIGEFFVAGRSLPWWLAGTSIVATTFAADTPLAVSGFVRSGGIYNNWIWWNILMGGMLCVFFYARLWRRAGILTDMEFIELRYEGRPASVLRGFMAVYSGVLHNCITMGWVMLAMAKICEVMLGWDKVLSLGVLVLVALIYTVLSGFWGVVVTDMIQFAMAMTGSVALAGIVLWRLGGPAGMVEQVSATAAFEPKVFDFVPDLKTAGKLAVLTFVIQVSVQWWANGQGNGYIAQRLFAAKDERHSALAALWFNLAHYILRPWPWIIVGLASLVYFPLTAGEDPEAAYPQMMAAFLPVGLRGLMVASLLAAFMSTMDTHLNWGASYLVNDLYKRFLVRNAPAGAYVLAARISILVLTLLAALTAWQFQTIRGAWMYLWVLMSGTGFVLLLRWYWWRVNPWSEISALAASFFVANGFLWARILGRLGLLSPERLAQVERFYSDDFFAVRLLCVVAVCTVVWVLATFVTRPVSRGHLERFFRQVRPGGWWGPVAAACPEVRRDRARTQWAGWFAGVACVYAGLFGIGYVCIAHPWRGLGCLAVSAIAGWAMLRVVGAPDRRRADERV